VTDWADEQATEIVDLMRGMEREIAIERIAHKLRVVRMRGEIRGMEEYRDAMIRCRAELSPASRA